VQIDFKDATDIREYLQAFAPAGAQWHTKWLDIKGYPTQLPVFHVNTGKF
jgi:hypothetical protein